MWFDATSLTWINPSPNMRSLTEATLYPGVGLLETTNVSVGRGTDTPFEVVGAPWIDGQRLANYLNARRIPGVRFVPVRFTPKSSVFKERGVWWHQHHHHRSEPASVRCDGDRDRGGASPTLPGGLESRQLSAFAGERGHVGAIETRRVSRSDRAFVGCAARSISPRARPRLALRVN